MKVALLIIAVSVACASVRAQSPENTTGTTMLQKLADADKKADELIAFHTSELEKAKYNKAYIQGAFAGIRSSAATTGTLEAAH